ncbi:hypothetical protein NLG97_g7236 [Lecanicillium saksenae]|uniref:Uncharacterized protein n=1 Tax=Lecanicillium saksenae TaxID=468837 RepID=A0ACC1QPX7_9HYPO|nr:hypothetical protein NLG97_g7236 [Lecanicillium saksenae]
MGLLTFRDAAPPNEETHVDPDIAGIGVMVSFLASASIMFAYILYGWFKNCIRTSSENQADLRIKQSLCALFRRKYNNVPASAKARADFEAIILAFSDQQLVTGLAILISIWIKGDITTYTFRVATSLA